jgi:hypothetical protein
VLIVSVLQGAPTYADAHKVASRISTSALVKTALYGEDAKYVPSPSPSLPLLLTRLFPRSWGRILASTGSVPLSVPLSPSRVSVSFIPADGSSALPVLVNGEPEVVDERRAKEILKEGEFEVRVELGLGKESARYWTCDFSYVSCGSLWCDSIRLDGILILLVFCDRNTLGSMGITGVDFLDAIIYNNNRRIQSNQYPFTSSRLP